MKRKYQIIIFISTVSCGLLVYLFYYGYIAFNYYAAKKFPIHGIDISHHQKNIDWQKLKNEDISFAFIKATEGGDFKDPKFEEYSSMSKLNGYAVGAYHFYRLCKSGSEQADNFIASVTREQIQLPPVIDLEFGGNCPTDKSTSQILLEIKDYIDKISAYYGQLPLIYSTQEFYNIYLKGNFEDCPIWIRDIYNEPRLFDDRAWLFWQFANKGHLSGIDGFVDLNAFNGDSQAFAKLLSVDLQPIEAVADTQAFSGTSID